MLTPIVFNDASLKKVMQGLLAGKFRGSGQTCVSPNRIYVQSGIYADFLAEFTGQVKEQMKAGALEDDSTALGCVINSKAIEKVTRLVADAKSKGASAVLGGEQSKESPPNFYPATILKDMTSDMEATHTEMFGPVASVYKFETEDELIAQANDSEVGLAAYIYTENLPVAWRTAEALQGKNSLPLPFLLIKTSLTRGLMFRSGHDGHQHRHRVRPRRAVRRRQTIRLRTRRRPTRNRRIPKQQGKLPLSKTDHD